jgi:hypothetical protein
LGHEAEESEEGPAEAIKAGVAVVWVSPGLHTRVALRAPPGRKERTEGRGGSHDFQASLPIYVLCERPSYVSIMFSVVLLYCGYSNLLEVCL